MAIRIMPCGFRRTGKLQDHLAHYRSCNHEACKARVQILEDLVEKLKRGQTSTGEIK